MHLYLDDFVSAVFQLRFKVLHVLQDGSSRYQERLDDLHLRIDDFDLDQNRVFGFWWLCHRGFWCVFFHLAVQFVQLLLNLLVCVV